MNVPVSVNGCIVLTPERAWCSGHDAANRQMRKACRKRWSVEDYNLAVAVQARLLRNFEGHHSDVADAMVEGDPGTSTPDPRFRRRSA